MGEADGRGVVAVGDSITVGPRRAMLDVPPHSWALWLAAALAVPYTSFAADRSSSDEVITAQLPRLRGRYELGCAYIGLNDLHRPGFDLDHYEANMGAIAAALHEHADRLLLVAPPLASGATVEVNAAIERVAGAFGAVLVRLDDLSGWRMIVPDGVHMTALGHLELAERALLALGAPASGGLAVIPAGRASLLRYWLTFELPMRIVERLRRLLARSR
jgi:hypothetical protein